MRVSKKFKSAKFCAMGLNIIKKNMLDQAGNRTLVVAENIYKLGRTFNKHANNRCESVELVNDSCLTSTAIS